MLIALGGCGSATRTRITEQAGRGCGWRRRCSLARARGGEPGQLRWRNALVAAQLPISLVLFVEAGLFLRSFRQVQSVDLGFGHEPKRRPDLPDAGHPLHGRRGAGLHAAPARPLPRAARRRRCGAPSATCAELAQAPARVSSNVGGFEPPSAHGAFIADRAEATPSFSRRRHRDRSRPR